MSKIYSKYLLIGALIIIGIGCSVPNEPDFSLSQKFELPLINNTRFFFLGGSDAFIDTTKGNGVDTLFSVDGDNTVFISYDEDVEIGNLDDAIPAIDVDASDLESEVGVIEIDDFSSNFDSQVGTINQTPESINNTEAEVGTFEPEVSGSGATSFLDITGSNPPNVAAPIVGGTSTIDIDLDAGNFVSATIESGGLRLDFSNNLGFDIASLEAQLFVNTDAVPSALGTLLTFNNVSHASSRSGVIAFNQNDVLETNLSVQVTLTWNNQTYQVNGSNSLTVSLADDNLIVSQAESELPQQVLSPSTQGISLADPNFSFATFASTGLTTVNQLSLTLTNNTALTLTSEDFTGSPTLTLTNSNNDVLDATKPINPSNQPILPNESVTVVFDLNGETLTKELSYSLSLGTPGSSGAAVSVSSTDNITIASSTTDLEVEETSSVIDAQSGIDLSDEAVVEGDFTQVEVSDGQLTITISNTLAVPLTIDELTIINKNAFKAKNTGRYFANGSEIGSIVNLQVDANGSASQSIDLAGKAIGDEIVFTAVASSTGSNGQAALVTSQDAIDVGVTGSISVQSATATLNPQDFSSSDVFTIDNDDFTFDDPSHFVGLQSGVLRIANLVNDLDVSLDTLIITVFDIQNAQDEPLVISFIGEQNDPSNFLFQKITRKENNSRPAIEIDLSGYKIKALNNQVRYDILGKTEDTELSSDPFRTISATDKVSASLSIENLTISEALGRINTKRFLLGDDERANGEDIVDIANDNEAEVVELDDLDEVADYIEDISLNGTNLSIKYTTDLGAEASVFMAIAGVDVDGNYLFLQGRGDKEVGATEDVPELYFNGQPIDKANLIKFQFGVNSSVPTQLYDGSITFNNTNSSVDEFLSSFPSEIRTIGVAVINPDQEPSTYVANPITFDTDISVDMPLSISTEAGSPLTINYEIEDFDLGLPDNEDDAKITTTSLRLTYENKLPLAIELSFEFKDENGNLVNVDYEPFTLDAAQVDANGFSTVAASGFTEFIFQDATQLSTVETADLIMKAQTSGNQIIRVKADDFFDIKLSVSTETNITQN